MAASVVAICNIALGMMGNSSSIESLDERSHQAQQMRRFYNPGRRAALEMHDWSFARKRQALAEHSVEPPDGVWGYRYQSPQDMLVARRLWVPHWVDKEPYEIEVVEDMRTILTNLPEAVLIYTYDCEAVTLWPSSFDLVVARHIAKLASPTLETRKAVGAHETLLAGDFNRARIADANQQADRAPRDSEMVTGRN